MKLQNIPNSWDDIPFETYLKLANIPFKEDATSEDELRYQLEITSIITGYSVESIRELKANDFMILLNHLSFLKEKVDITKYDKTKIKFKPLDDLTFDEFVQYENSKKNMNDNVVTILSIFLNGEKSEQDILNMPTTEVLASFFTLRNTLINYMNTSLKSLSRKILKKKLIEKLQFWKKK